MIDQSSLYKNRWWQRILDSRRQYFFEHVSRLHKISDITFLQTVKWIAGDIFYASKRIIHIILQIRAYGKTIRKKYGLSYYRQWLCLMYVVFFLRSDPKYFRWCSLFKPKQWTHVNDFTFTHHCIQHEFIQLTSAEEKEILDNKYIFFETCRSKNIQTPDVLAVFKHGEMIYQKSVNYLPPSSVFVKKIDGQKGKGIKKFLFHNGNYVDKEDNIYSVDDFTNLLKSVSIKFGGIILQPALENHDLWKGFTPGGLATCRLVTAKSPEKNNETIPLFCGFRMPVGNSIVDNYSSGGIMTSVHLETGKMGRAVSLNPINHKFEFTEHPDTHHQIENAVIPHWSELLEFTLKLHKHFKTIFVGWDVCMTKDGCCVLEGNTNWAAGSYEIPFQDSLKNTIYPELFEKWMDKYAALHD